MYVRVAYEKQSLFINFSGNIWGLELVWIMLGLHSKSRTFLIKIIEVQDLFLTVSTPGQYKKLSVVWTFSGTFNCMKLEKNYQFEQKWMSLSWSYNQQEVNEL